MLPLGYTTTAALFTVATVVYGDSKLALKYYNQIKPALSNKLPEENGKAAYVALECIGRRADPSSFFPSPKEIIIRRYKILETSFNLDVGIGMDVTLKGDPSIVVTPRSNTKIYPIAIPNLLKLSSQFGNVIVQNPDLADWPQTAISEKFKYHPNQAAPLLRSLSIQPNLAADSYHVEVQALEGPNITVFAEAIKNGGAYILDRPKDDSPFILTNKNPQNFANAFLVEAKVKKRTAKLFGLSGIMVGIGTFTFQTIRHVDTEWADSGKFPKKILMTRLPFCAGAFLATFCLFQKTRNTPIFTEGE